MRLPGQDTGEPIPALERQVTLAERFAAFSAAPCIHKPARRRSIRQRCNRRSTGWRRQTEPLRMAASKPLRRETVATEI